MSTNNQDFNPISTDTAFETVRDHLAMRTPFLFVGLPGCGKTTIPKQVAREEKIKSEIIYGGTPSDDINNLITIAPDGSAIINPAPIFSTISISPEEPALIIVDEVHQMDKKGHALMAQVIYDPYKIGVWYKPELWTFCFTANRQQDKTGGGGFASHFVNRGAAYTINLEVGTPPGILSKNGSGWLGWAARNELEPEVLAFIEREPQYLSTIGEDLEKERKDANYKQFQSATPRQWEEISKLIKYRKEAERGYPQVHQLIARLGTEAGSRFNSFLKIFETGKHIPTYQQIIANPTQVYCPNPNNISDKDAGAYMWVIIGALTKQINPKDINQVAQYLMRLPADYAVSAMMRICNKHSNLVMLSGGAWGDLIAKCSEHLA